MDRYGTDILMDIHEYYKMFIFLQLLIIKIKYLVDKIKVTD